MRSEYRLQAMSLAVPVVAGGHPNRLAISGVLTRVGEPSDAAPNGSGGKRVMLTAEAAERALPSLLGMGLDLTSDLEGHDPTRKIGVITAAHIDGNALNIEAFLWASDFPAEALRVQLNQAKLGFSFEANTRVRDQQADVLVIDELVFTGAAILESRAGAYRTTALACMAGKMKEHLPVNNDLRLAASGSRPGQVGGLSNGPPLLRMLASAGVRSEADLGDKVNVRLSETQLETMLAGKSFSDRIAIKAAMGAAGLYPATLKTHRPIAPLFRF